MSERLWWRERRSGKHPALTRPGVFHASWFHIIAHSYCAPVLPPTLSPPLGWSLGSLIYNRWDFQIFDFWMILFGLFTTSNKGVVQPANALECPFPVAKLEAEADDVVELGYQGLVSVLLAT